MAPLTKPIISGMLLALSGLSIGQVFAASTDIKARIVDGVCQVSVDKSVMIFGPKNASQFINFTAELQPLEVKLDCVGMQGKKPKLYVWGIGEGVNDIQVFRENSLSSGARGIAFMLKQGSHSSLADFANINSPDRSIGPWGQEVPISQDEGSSTEPFTVGMVGHQSQWPPTGGTVGAKLTFSFVFP